VLDTNGESLVLQVVSENSWLATESKGGGGGGSSAPVDIFYADLYDKIVNSQLVAGQKYRLTDYRSVNFLNGWGIANNNPTPTDPSFDPRQIHVGDNEVLILEAISSYELNPVCNSETHGGDILEFQGYTNKIGVDFDIYTGQTLPDATTVTDFNLKWDGTNVYFDMPTNYPALFGHYFYLYAEFGGGAYYQDGAFEPLTPVIAECQYPYTSNDPNYGYPKAVSRLSVSPDGMKVILLDLVEADYLAYDVDSLYVQSVYSIGDAFGWITRRNDTQRQINVPFDFRGRKYRRYEVDLTPINPALGLGYWGQGDVYLGQPTTGNYIDVPSFGQDGYDAYDIQWEGMGGADMYWYTGYSDNNVFLGYFYKNNLKDFTRNNTTGNNFFDNTIGNYFYFNTIGNNFDSNTTGNNFFDNTIGNYFYFNTIGNNFNSNTIGNEFYSNTIGNNFNSNTIGNNFNSNTIGNEFYSNTIGNVFYSNTIGNYFFINTIGNNFYENTIGNNFFINTIGNNFYENTTGNNFSDNTIGDNFFDNAIRNNFTRNTIGNNFYSNTTESGFGRNTIGNDFQSNNIENTFFLNTTVDNFRRNQIEYSPSGTDFSLANFVYEDYTCNIFKNSVGAYVLTFVNGSNVIEYKNITD
jgi:hypothetical protein